MGSNDHEHIINLITDNASSSSSSGIRPFLQNPPQHEDPLDHSSSTVERIFATSSAFVDWDDGYGYNNGTLNSSLSCLSIELVVIGQIILSGLILWLAEGDVVPTPLFTWVKSYACSCVATLSTRLWRLWNLEWDIEQIPGDGQDSLDSNPRESIDADHSNTGTSSIRLRGPLSMLFDELMDHFKIAVDFIFAWWFIIGDLWFFEDSPPTQTAAIFRALVMFLALSCIYYSVPVGMIVILNFFSSPIPWGMSLREDNSQSSVATPERLNSLTRYMVKKVFCVDGYCVVLGERTISEEDAFCCICLAEYADNDEVRELPCFHTFHVECVDRWLKINGVCPLCRNEVWPSEEQQVNY